MKTMMDYIHEEPQVLETILQQHSFEENQQYAKMQQLLILATGSSYNACLSAKVALEKLAGIHVVIEEPYHFNHYGTLSPTVDTVLAVSQSGKSASTIDAIEQVKKQGTYTMAMTSDLSSPIAEKVEKVIDLEMGIETVGFVTKGYTATVLKLFLLGLSVGQAKGRLSNEKLNEYKEQLLANIRKIPMIIKKTEHFFETHQAIFKLSNRFVTIGYGPNWGTAKEFETKFTETIRKPSQGFELEAYMHGPYLEADNEHVLFFVEAPSTNQIRSEQLRRYMQASVAKTFVVTTENSTNTDVISLAMTCDEVFSSLFLVIPFQILAFRGAAAKGIDLSQRIFDDFDTVLKSKI